MSKIYGSPLWLSGGGGMNDTLPPLLDNFKVTRNEGNITLSASKMEESRAKDLAGAVWVYGEHIPQNKNDGTKIELTRDEVIMADKEPFITLADIPVSDAKTETIVNLKESDGKLHPYLYLMQNYNNNGKALLLRKKIGTLQGVTIGWGDSRGGTYHKWCNDTFFNTIIDASVAREISPVLIPILGSGEVTVKVFALSRKEYGYTDNGYGTDGTPIAYFSSPQKRIAYFDGGGACEHYTRTNVTATVMYIDTNGNFQMTAGSSSERKGLRLAFCLPHTFKLKVTPNEDGSYDMYEGGISTAADTSDSTIVERTVAWDESKSFYARQFTYNSQNQYQTMLEGAIASPDIVPEGQELSKLPSKSKVKLGKFNGQVLKWLVCRDSVDQSLRLILDGESVGVIGNKMADNAEPNYPDANRRGRGNSRYFWSNIHQWLNNDKPANQWYTAQHTYDAPPDYTDIAGFLHEWTEKEIGVLENASWVVTKCSLDGGGTESFQNRIVLPSTTEMGVESNTGGARIDIFNSDSDRVVSSKYYWCRTPYPSDYGRFHYINAGGALYYNSTTDSVTGVRPLCKPIPTTLVSLLPDGDGCYTLV